MGASDIASPGEARRVTLCGLTGSPNGGIAILLPALLVLVCIPLSEADRASTLRSEAPDPRRPHHGRAQESGRSNRLRRANLPGDQSDYRMSKSERLLADPLGPDRSGRVDKTTGHGPSLIRQEEGI